MNEFLEIVKERPDKSLEKNKCPFCGEKVNSSGTETTLVGGPAGVNHEWTSCECPDCGKSYTFESKSLNNWITQDSKVMFGIPTCFETYIYTCSKCDGTVKQKNVDRETGAPVTCLSFKLVDGYYVNQYTTIFYCEDCGASVESENDYYIDLELKEKKRKPMETLDYKGKVTFGNSILFVSDDVKDTIKNIVLTEAEAEDSIVIYHEKRPQENVESPL